MIDADSSFAADHEPRCYEDKENAWVHHCNHSVRSMAKSALVRVWCGDFCVGEGLVVSMAEVRSQNGCGSLRNLL